MMRHRTTRTRRLLSSRNRRSTTRAPEQLEPRAMLACGTSIAESPGLLPEHEEPVAAETVSILADAGSTRATAHDVGTLDGSESRVGTVGRYDRSDVFRFEIESAAEVTVSLTGMFADLDLALHDAAGRRLELSDNPSNRIELIQSTLTAGTYYAVVDPYRWAYSGYRIEFTATISEPTPEPEPPATELPPAEDEPPASDAPATDSPAEPTPTEPPATSFPDVPYFGGSNEWNLNAINVPEVWAGGYAGAGVTVAVVDTGIDLDHADLVSNLWVNPGEIPGNGLDDDQNGFIDDIHGWDFAEGDNNPNDLNGHGTHVAGTIAADDNGFGATGVAPDATLMAIKVLGNNGSGSTFDVAAGIRYAAANGADIINLSLGGGFSSAIRSAIAYAESLGSLVVAAAGNESAGLPGFPARFSADFSNTISVGAHSSSSRIAGFSNEVGSSGAVQIDAPGVGVHSTYAGGRYTRLSGTSMASPHVAGVAALLLSANGNLAPAQVRSFLVDGADRSIAGSDGIGGINAAATLALALGGQAQATVANVSPFLSSSQATQVRASFAPIVAISDSARFSSRGVESTDESAASGSPVNPTVADDTHRAAMLAATDRIADEVLHAISVDATEDDGFWENFGDLLGGEGSS